MKVKELIEALEAFPHEAEVVMSSDGEGNGFSPLCDAEKGYVYIPENTWSGEIYEVDTTADDMRMDEEEWAEIKAKHSAVILRPTN